MSATTGVEHSPSGHPLPSCLDFTEFKDYLKDTRKLDDTVILTLNKTDGSPEQCAPVWNRFLSMYAYRERIIRQCIVETDRELQRQPEDAMMIKARSSFLNSELRVEDILRLQVMKIFKTKCPGFKPEVPR
eukprot:TRINITY_DN27075_c0_g1_i1.p2 TRINITY_DN27075_c0_g1~~TRINITY_DN27075_c0_g1_i1.p2  ORF type:complete len:131 (-),score=17.61 TRINITY_DN27075_c0_g1_i1:227-619(-)